MQPVWFKFINCITESHYREALAKEKEKIALEKEQNWLKQIPLKSMIDWGWVDKFQNKGDQVRSVCEYVLRYSPFFEQIPPERSQHAPYPLSY
jgi:hypothetical protein